VSRSPSASPVAPRSYEAEAPGNVIGSGARIAPMDGASGGSGVYAIGGTNGGVLRFTGVSVPTAGKYTVTVYYQNPGTSSRVGWITVNAGNPIRMDVGSTGGCCVGTHTVTVTLRAGDGNTLEFGNPDTRAPDIDRIVVSA
jgi:alpha-galactosidase